jgi:hypothetical protein
LRSLIARHVLEIAWIHELDAYQRYGSACARGALVVKTHAKAAGPT